MKPKKGQIEGASAYAMRRAAASMAGGRVDPDTLAAASGKAAALVTRSAMGKLASMLPDGTLDAMAAEMAGKARPSIPDVDDPGYFLSALAARSSAFADRADSGLVSAIDAAVDALVAGGVIGGAE